LLNTSTGRTAELTGRGTPDVWFEYRKVPESILVDQTRPIMTDRTRHCVRSTPHVLLSLWTSDWMHRWQTLVRAPLLQRWTDRTRQPRLVTSTSASDHYQWPPFTSVSIHDDLDKFTASGVVENMHFTSTKALNPSLPLKLDRLRKCANTTRCTSPCVCVLAFSQSFLRR
jgi:hypothetical protein